MYLDSKTFKEIDTLVRHENLYNSRLLVCMLDLPLYKAYLLQDNLNYLNSKSYTDIIIEEIQDSINLGRVRICKWLKMNKRQLIQDINDEWKEALDGQTTLEGFVNHFV
jgi:hypothetical protein